MMLRNVNRSLTQHRLQTLCLNSRVVGSSTTFYRSESSASSSGQPTEYESKFVETLKVAGDNANTAKDSKLKTLKAIQTYSALEKEAVDSGIEQNENELSAAFPDINLRAKEGSLTEEELNAFIVHASTRINQLKEQLAEHQKVEELTKKENVNLIAELQQQKQNFEGRIAQLQQEKNKILKELGQKFAEEEDEQIMLPMHEMKVQLPLENWFDLLALVPRQQLGNIASQIGDFQFACILQSFLHDDHRKITLSRMKIIPPRRNVPSDRPMVQARQNGYIAMDLPDWPMPQNVNNFEHMSLHFHYYDMPVVDFLRKFQENSLLTNVKLDLGYEDKHPNQLLPILNKMVPLISSMSSIHFCELNLFDWAKNSDEESKLLLKEMVAKTRILAIQWDTHGVNCTRKYKIDWCCSWLYTPREDGMPRALVAEMYTLRLTHCSSFIDRLKKDFLEANHAVSFIIRLITPRNFQQEISLENNKTNENLVVKSIPDERLLISRHSSKAAKHKIEEDEKEISEWERHGGTKRIYLTPFYSNF